MEVGVVATDVSVIGVMVGMIVVHPVLEFIMHR